jgi:hypothetical protein
MAISVYNTLQTYTATASSEATGYTDDNLSVRSIKRSWRSGALPITNATIVFNLGADVQTYGLLVWDTNIPASGIVAAHSEDNISYSNFSTVTIAKNAGNRRYALIDTSGAGTKQYLKLTITAAAGSTSDGANYAEIGRVCIFRAVNTYCFTYPLNIATTRPGIYNEYLNGVPSVASTGANYSTLDLTSEGTYGAYDYDALAALLVASPCAVDTALYGTFLVEDVSNSYSKTMDSYLYSTYTLNVRECV